MRRYWLLLVLLAGAGCGSRGQIGSEANTVEVRADDLVGCYDVRFAGWNPPLTRDPDFHQVPEVVELRSEWSGLSGIRGDHRALSPTMLVELPPDFRLPQPGSWTMESADSLFLLWTDGYTGVRMDARVTTVDTIAAVATVLHDDQIGEPPRSEVILVRVPCQ